MLINSCSLLIIISGLSLVSISETGYLLSPLYFRYCCVFIYWMNFSSLKTLGYFTHMNMNFQLLWENWELWRHCINCLPVSTVAFVVLVSVIRESRCGLTGPSGSGPVMNPFSRRVRGLLSLKNFTGRGSSKFTPKVCGRHSAPQGM